MTARRWMALTLLVAFVVLLGGSAAASSDGSEIAERAKGQGCNADPTPLTGDGYLKGTMKPDRILGGAGNDRLDGFSGTDCLFGSTGIDVLFGGKDKDKLDGGPEIDFLYGGEAADVVIGVGDGAVDFLYGGSSNDVIQAGPEDWCYGQGGTDQYSGCAPGRIVN